MWTGGLIGFDRIPCFSGILDSRIRGDLQVEILVPYDGDAAGAFCDEKSSSRNSVRTESDGLNFWKNPDSRDRNMNKERTETRGLWVLMCIQGSGVLSFCKSPNQGPQA